MAAKTQNKLAVTREDLAEALHTALRKCCDSRPTTLLWNMIYVIDGGVWQLYLDHVWSSLSVLVDRGETAKVILKSASLKFRASVDRRNDKIEGHSVTLLDLLFRDFSENDWAGYAEYLTEY